MSFFKKVPENNRSIELEIESDSVRGLYRVTQEGNEKVFFAESLPVAVKDEEPTNRLESLLRSATDYVAAELNKQAVKANVAGPVDSVTCYFAAPWILKRSAVVTLDDAGITVFSAHKNIETILATRHQQALGRTKKVVSLSITSKTLEQLTQKGVEEILNVGLSKYIGAAADECSIVQREIEKIYLNGYAVASAEGKRAHSVIALVSVAIVPNSVIILVQDSLDRHLMAEKSSNASLLARRSVFLDRDHDQVLISVGNETTEVGRLEQGVLYAMTSFPVGRNHFIRHIMKTRRLPFEPAFSIFALDPSLTDDFSLWQQQTRRAIDQLYAETVPPVKFVLMADARSRSFFLIKAPAAMAPATGDVQVTPRHASALGRL